MAEIKDESEVIIKNFLKNLKLSQGLFNVMNEMTEKYGRMDPSKYGSFSEMLQAQRKVIEKRKRSYHVQEGWGEKEEKSEEAKGTPTVGTPTIKPSNHDHGTVTETPTVISDITDNKKENDDAIVANSDTIKNIEEGSIDDLKKKRRIEAGFLYRIELKDGKAKLVKEDIEKAGYTKNINNQLKNELDKLKQEIDALPNGEQKKKMKKQFRRTKSAIKYENSQVKKLELLLALKMSLDVNEKADFMQRFEGNVFPKGMSDLQEYYHDETRIRFLLPTEIILTRSENEVIIEEKMLEEFGTQNGRKIDIAGKHVKPKKSKNPKKTKETGEKEPGE